MDDRAVRAVRRLSPADVERLRRESFTYDEVGASAAPYPSGFPPGYRLTQHTEVIGRGRAAFEAASERLLGWRMHLDSGLRVAASTPTVEAGSLVVCRLGVGPVSLRIPCRVVYLIDEPDRRGFGYGTLPGHPETGEERFEVEILDDEVSFTVSTFSNTATRLSRLGGPVSWWVQERALRRYAAALRCPSYH